MHFESLRVKGLGVFRDEVAVNFESLPGKLAAVVGQNGSGKSSLLELLFGAATRECPTRGTLVDLARDRDAFLEVKLVNGAPHTILHTLDAISKKSEALVLDDAGAPVLPTTSVKAFDDWAKSHLPSPEVMLSSLFAAQQHGGFCDMSARGRKEVLSKVLGIEAFEGMAERARKRANEAREALAGIAGELRALPELDSPAIDAALHVARADAAAADQAIAEARNEQQAAIAYRAKAAALIADRTSLKDLETRIENNRSCLVDAARIRVAVERSRVIEGEVTTLRNDAEVAASQSNSTDRECRAARAMGQRARDAIRAATSKADAARSRLALRPEIDEANDRLPMAQQIVEEIEARANDLSQEIANIQASMLGVADARIAGLRWPLSQIALDPTDAVSLAVEAIESDDAREEAARTAPTRVTEAKKRLADAQRELPAARAEVARLERLSARAGELEAAEREIQEAETAIAAAKGEEENASAEALRLDRELDTLRNAAADREGKIGGLVAEQQTLAPLLRKAAPLADAEAKIAGYAPRAAELRVKVSETALALASLPEPRDLDIDAIEARVGRAHGAVGRYEGELAHAQVADLQRKRLHEKKSAIELDIADWVLLAEDLGASGLPALLIDAAGPELTALCNDLLHTCVGTRWTVSIETTRLSADGKRAIETCEVRVIDTEAGREAEVSTFSGGERALLNESVSLALTMLACRRSGLEKVTLVRDETGAALDDEKGRAYIGMLRRAADIVGASKVLFVAHDRALQELADSRIVVADGKVSIQ